MGTICYGIKKSIAVNTQLSRQLPSDINSNCRTLSFNIQNETMNCISLFGLLAILSSTKYTTYKMLTNLYIPVGTHSKICGRYKNIFTKHNFIPHFVSRNAKFITPRPLFVYSWWRRKHPWPKDTDLFLFCSLRCLLC